MNAERYIIKWKHENGRSGEGRLRMTRDKAYTVAQEMNRDFPHIHHEVVELTDSDLTQDEHKTNL